MGAIVTPGGVDLVVMIVLFFCGVFFLVRMSQRLRDENVGIAQVEAV